ncbi:MAG: DUF6065 family protein [Acidimicrobiia bacterium]
MDRWPAEEPWVFRAYPVSTHEDLAPRPSSRRRAWMEATSNGFARRCLPLVMANQAGWVVRLPFGLHVTWSGSAAPGSMDIRQLGPEHPARSIVSDHFGWGVLTFNIPFVFRTRAGTGLLVRGAPNFWVKGAHPLEGLVETDWATVTFTMNWKVLDPGRLVEFREGDPICFLQPIDVGVIEAARPEIVDLEVDPDVSAGYQAWAQSRAAFLADERRRDADWQKHYFVGDSFAGRAASSHRTTLAVSPFDGARAARAPAVAERRPVKGAVQLVREEGEEFVIGDTAGGEHRLNATALFVLECCTGINTPSDIAEMTRIAFGLDTAPADAVDRCLSELLRSGLVEAGGSQPGRGQGGG